MDCLRAAGTSCAWGSDKGIFMAVKNEGSGEPCPRCGKELVVIESTLVKWLNCPSCKFKKLVEREDRGTIKFTPITEK